MGRYTLDSMMQTVKKTRFWKSSVVSSPPHVHEWFFLDRDGDYHDLYRCHSCGLVECRKI